MLTAAVAVAALDAHRLEAEALHHLFEDAPLGGVVFYDQNARCHAREIGSEG
jgi:hypothetical protein